MRAGRDPVLRTVDPSLRPDAIDRPALPNAGGSPTVQAPSAVSPLTARRPPDCPGGGVWCPVPDQEEAWAWWDGRVYTTYAVPAAGRWRYLPTGAAGPRPRRHRRAWLVVLAALVFAGTVVGLLLMRGSQARARVERRVAAVRVAIDASGIVTCQGYWYEPASMINGPARGSCASPRLVIEPESSQRAVRSGAARDCPAIEGAGWYVYSPGQLADAAVQRSFPELAPRIGGRYVPCGNGSSDVTARLVGAEVVEVSIVNSTSAPANYYVDVVVTAGGIVEHARLDREAVPAGASVVGRLTLSSAHGGVLTITRVVRTALAPDQLG